MAFWIRHLAESIERDEQSTLSYLVDKLQGWVDALVAALPNIVAAALIVLGLSKTVTTLLAGVGILGLALGFAFQDIAENFIAGVLMAFRRPIYIGDLIESNDFVGTVEEINLRTTVIRTADGKHVLIPNSEVLQNSIVNFSRSSELRVDLACGVSYGDDLAGGVTLEEALAMAPDTLDNAEGRADRA